jgi:hypothetical protein
MANRSDQWVGNNFEFSLTPRCNTIPFWTSVPFETQLRLLANDPLIVTRPVVTPEMNPELFIEVQNQPYVLDSISVKYEGSQGSVNTLFVYGLVDEIYYCIGSIQLPAHGNSLQPPAGPIFGQGNPLVMVKPPILLGQPTIKRALRISPLEAIYVGVAQELSNPIVVIARGSQYDRLEDLALVLGEFF